MRTTICARTTKYFCCGGTWTFKSFFDNRTNLLFCGSHSRFSSSLRPVTRKNFSFTKRLFVRKPFHFYSARSAAEKAFLNDQEEEYDCTSRDKMLIVAEKKPVSCSNLHNRNCRALIFCLFTDRENNRKTYSKVEINVTVKIVYNKAMSIRELLIFSMRGNVLPRLCLYDKS